LSIDQQRGKALYILTIRGHVNNYTELDATALAELVRKKEVQPKELVEAAISAIEKVNPTLNAVVLKMYDQAREAAQRPVSGVFGGVPFVFKDLDGSLANVPYTMGCRFLKNYIPTHNAEIVSRILNTGVIPVAKTNCPELGIVGYTEPELHGPTKNPWNTGHTPGGSSGGTAAAVAARVVPMGHGGDGGGSIRIPASHCGLFGLKTSRARNPLGPDYGEGWGGYVQPGVLTRSVRDCAAMLDATHGPERGAPYYVPAPARPFLEEVGANPAKLKIAFSYEALYADDTHPDCKRAIQEAVTLCKDLGHEVVEAKPLFQRQALVRAYLVQVATGVAASLKELEQLMGRAPKPEDVEAPTWLLAQIGQKLSAVDLELSRAESHRAGRDLATFFETHDIFISSTTAQPAVKIGELGLKSHERVGLAVLRRAPIKKVLDLVLEDLAKKSLAPTPNTQLFNQTGQPAMSVPLYWNADNLPIGVQFAARFGDEASLFRLAAQLEIAKPWTNRKPRVCA
jgi:amidase